MRIAFVAHPNSPNSWYRAIGPIAALDGGPHDLREVMPEAGTFRGELVRGCDVLLIHRFCSPEVLQAVDYAKRAGIGVVWDNDDDLRAVPRRDPAYRLLGGAKSGPVQAAIARVVRLADVVTTPSALLAEHYRSLGAEDVRVIENYVRDDSLRVTPSRAGSRRNGARDLVVGWVAGGEHRIDVERLPIGDALMRLLDAHAGLRVVTVGASLGIRHDRYVHRERIPFLELDRETATFDVGIAPLADIAFNRARSNVKLKEYAVLGVPWLASPTGPYVGLGEQQGGRLVDYDGWHAAIDGLLTNARERRRLAKRASRWGRSQVMSANVAATWQAALEDARERAGAGGAGVGGFSPAPGARGDDGDGDRAAAGRMRQAARRGRPR